MVVLAGLKLRDLTLADLFDASNLEVVLGSCRLGELLKADGVIWTLEEAWGVWAAVLDLEPVKSLLLRLAQHDELVWDDAHLLESNCLYLCHWEALYDPALLVLLHGFDLSPHKLDDDVVGDV